MKREQMKEVMETTLDAIGRKPDGHDERKGYGNYWDLEDGNEFYSMVGTVKDRLLAYRKENSPFQWRKLHNTQWRGNLREENSITWINLALCINSNKKLRLYVEFNYLDADREDFQQMIEELGF